MNENKEIFIWPRVNPFIYKNEWHKNNRFIILIVLPHTNWQNATKAGRTNSRTNCQQNRIAISPSTRPSSAQKIIGSRIWIYDVRSSTASMMASTTPSRYQTIPLSQDGMRWWNQEKCSTKSRQHTGAQHQQPYFRMIRFFEACIPHKMPQKCYSDASKTAKKYKSSERIHTQHNSYSIMLFDCSCKQASTPMTLRIGTARVTWRVMSWLHQRQESRYLVTYQFPVGFPRYPN